jgi:hypothetical protein
MRYEHTDFANVIFGFDKKIENFYFEYIIAYKSWLQQNQAQEDLDAKKKMSQKSVDDSDMISKKKTPQRTIDDSDILSGLHQSRQFK